MVLGNAPGATISRTARRSPQRAPSGESPPKRRAAVEGREASVGPSDGGASTGSGVSSAILSAEISRALERNNQTLLQLFSAQTDKQLAPLADCINRVASTVTTLSGT
eukprot:1151745-Lingulodinium_polyedra.AAC.1